MRLTIRIGVAIGIAALTACAQSGQDNSTATETVLPPDESSSAGSDTLGTQLDQLNESEESGTAAGNNATTNGY